MLVITRRVGERIRIGPSVIVTAQGSGSGAALLEITTPLSITVLPEGLKLQKEYAAQDIAYDTPDAARGKPRQTKPDEPEAKRSAARKNNSTEPDVKGSAARKNNLTEPDVKRSEERADNQGETSRFTYGDLRPPIAVMRAVDESLLIGSEIEVMVVSAKNDVVKLGVKAPRHVQVLREEVFERIAEETAAAAAARGVPEIPDELRRLMKPKEDEE